jgi:hypothetical protein
MSYVILRQGNYNQTPDLLNFSQDQLNDNAKYLFERHTNVYYSDHPDKSIVQDLIKLK